MRRGSNVSLLVTTARILKSRLLAPPLITATSKLRILEFSTKKWGATWWGHSLRRRVRSRSCESFNRPGAHLQAPGKGLSGPYSRTQQGLQRGRLEQLKAIKRESPD